MPGVFFAIALLAPASGLAGGNDVVPQEAAASPMMEEREDKIRAVQRLQQALRKRALARKASARLMQGRSVEHKAAGMARAWRAKAVVPSSQEAKELV